MQVMDQQSAVGQWVRQRPSRSRVFDRFGIDFCCGGKISLQTACQRKGVDIDEVLQALRDEEASTENQGLIDADAMMLAELCDHIEATHHAYLREELPRLDRMTEKVARVHGEKQPKLKAIREAFVALRGELEPHMMKEERILFPMVRQLEDSSQQAGCHCGSIENPIRQMELEHDHAGDALARIREAADDFVAPDWACNTYRAMLDGLQQLEQDLHQHIHKENNVLFPKAFTLESLAAGSRLG